MATTKTHLQNSNWSLRDLLSLATFANPATASLHRNIVQANMLDLLYSGSWGGGGGGGGGSTKVRRDWVWDTETQPTNPLT